MSIATTSVDTASTAIHGALITLVVAVVITTIALLGGHLTDRLVVLTLDTPLSTAHCHARGICLALILGLAPIFKVLILIKVASLALANGALTINTRRDGVGQDACTTTLPTVGGVFF